MLVSAGLLSRQVELRAIHEFLQSAAERTSGLVIEGEAGIGKTTLWLAAQDDARARGFEVLSARVGETESVLAYAAVADLLGDLDPAILAKLPDLQRLAVDRVLLRASSTEGPETDQRVVAAAFTAAVEHVAVEKPLLLSPSTMCSGWIRPARRSWRSPRGGSAAGSASWPPSGAIRTAGPRRRGCTWPGPTVLNEFGSVPSVLVGYTR